VLLSFDVGIALDLSRARERLAAGATPGPFRHRRSAGAQEVGRCVRMTLAAPSWSVGKHASAAAVHVTLHELGAVTAAWSLPIAGSTTDAAALAGLLHDNPEILERGRALAVEIIERMGDAITRPALSSLYEDYLVFHLRETRCDEAGLASILRAEPGLLSGQEVASALETPISYAPGETCYVDWLSAVLGGASMEDELRVLELANVTLLELRVLDHELTAVIEGSYAAFQRSALGLSALSGRYRDVRRVSRMQADSALLQENVRNAHKLVGDDYLARLYGRAAQRFRLADWDTSTTRKLSLLASVTERMTDAAAHRRAELLEWIIILLIALDIVVVLL
jgi:hypothetical protein